MGLLVCVGAFFPPAAHARMALFGLVLGFLVCSVPAVGGGISMHPKEEEYLQVFSVPPPQGVGRNVPGQECVY